MALTNIWQRFKGLLPTGNRIVVTIIAINGNGTSQAQLRNGSIVTVIGDSILTGEKVFIVDGKVVGEVPSLTQYEVEV